MLDAETLKSTIVEILTDFATREQPAIEEFAERLSNAIDVYVKGATIIYTDGLIAPLGAVTGVFNGKVE